MSDAPGTAPANANLTITRDAPDDVQDRWVRLVLDGGPEEILRYGHLVGQAVHVRCFNRVAKGGVLMLLTAGFAFISVRLELTPDPAPAPEQHRPG